MGGCRCVYRKCQNTTTQSPDLHYFHFPVRDPARCEQWIVNAQRPSFRNMDKNKLRNKVVCSAHFEKKCFINENHDRLIHNAVPTVGFEEQDEERSNAQNSSLGSTDDIDVMLIPLNEDNTKFILPDVGFSGMSYTLCNDTLIPTNKLNYNSNRSELKTISFKTDIPRTSTRPIIKRIKTSFPLKQAFTLSPLQLTEPAKLKCIQQSMKTINVAQERSEAEVINGRNISTYSVSTVNGDVSLQPSTDSDMSNLNVDRLISEYQTDSSSSLLSDSGPALLDNISLHLKSNNEYTISVAPAMLPENNTLSENLSNIDDISQDSTKNSPISDMEVEQNSTIKESTTSISTPEKQYIRTIENHSKQIKQLKNLVQKQAKINKLILNRKRAPPVKRKLNKTEILDLVKPYLKPSLAAILKLELLPIDDVVLSDSEEKFITDLYTENPDCYNLLKNKWKWNLPSEKNGKSKSD